MCVQTVGRANINGRSAGLPTHLTKLRSPLNFASSFFFYLHPEHRPHFCTVSSIAEDGEFFSTHVLHVCYPMLMLTENSFPSSFLQVTVSGDVRWLSNQLVLLNGKANTERERNRDLQCRYDNLPEGAEFSLHIDTHKMNLPTSSHRNRQVRSTKRCLYFLSAQVMGSEE
jgi:hypothetical protein